MGFYTRIGEHIIWNGERVVECRSIWRRFDGEKWHGDWLLAVQAPSPPIGT